MSRWLADKVSSVLASRTDRRGMLVRSAIVGSALAANPVDFVLRPMSAYAAACQCRGQPCSCGTACCDGYTEFCCTITGTNACPGGTVAAGWWKANGTGFCGGGPRYYMDCNQITYPCGCTCAGGSCSHRVTCCTHFRYGQCHQEIPQVGPIVCRVITCTPPWVVDPTCTTVSATDQATAFHDAPCLHEPEHKEEEELPPAPAVTVDNSGHQWVFVRGTDATLWAKRDNEPWFTLGGGLTSGPDAMVTPDGKILVVARGLDGSTWQIVRDTAGNWTNWFTLGGQS